MDKLQISIPNGKWGTLNTKYPADSGGVSINDFTAGTSNAETSAKGSITKRKGSITYSTLDTPPRDMFEAIFSDGVRHLLTVDDGVLNYSPGDGAVNEVLNTLSPALYNEFVTTQDRVYFSNSVTSKVYDRSTSYGGVSYTFPTDTIKNMGAQAPVSAPTFAADSNVGGVVPVGNHHYKVTFLYYGSEESNGSPASAIHAVSAPNLTVNLTAIPIGGYGVTARKVYRDDDDGVYVLVGVIDNNTDVDFIDTLDAGLTPIPEFNDTPPAFSFVSFWLDRLLISGVSGDPYTVFYSNISQPDIFDPDNFIDCNQEDSITGTVVYLGRPIVFNRRSMGQILGDTSDSFRYSSIEPSIGCVDNRTIQIRVLNGIPTLMWLSDKGMYGYDGSAVFYMSDTIEDQLNLNIQQVSVQKGKITNSSLADWTGGDSTDGVNLGTEPGTILNKGPFWKTSGTPPIYPTATFEDQTVPTVTFDAADDWKGGELLEDAMTEDNNILKTIAPIAPNTGIAGGGVFTGDAVNPTDTLTLTSITAYTGESKTNNSTAVYGHPVASSLKVAYPITVPYRNGTLGTFSFYLYLSGGSTSISITGQFYTNSGGSPGSPIGSSFSCVVRTTDTSSIPLPSPFNSGVLRRVDATRNEPLNVGSYWIVLTVDTSGSAWRVVPMKINPTFSGGAPKNYNGSTWLSCTTPTGSTFNNALQYYNFTQAVLTKSGTWTSPVVDSFSTSTTNSSISVLSAVPNVCTAHVIMTAADDVFLLINPVSYDYTLPVGTLAAHLQATGVSGKRYYRITVTLSTSNDVFVPTVKDPRITFPTTATWISNPIDMTSDVSIYNTTSGTSVSGADIYFATSSDNITYNSFVLLGSFNLSSDFLKWVKIKIVAIGADTATTMKLNWSVLSTFTSSKINTGVTPSGWDVFQATHSDSGVTFYMRSAASSGALDSATWYQVESGQFPDINILPLQWVQWKAELLSQITVAPSIDSVAVSWFIGNNTGLRAASIFYNKNYYLSVGEFGSDTNNLILEYDFEGKWRAHRDIHASVFSYFFNAPYFGDAVDSTVGKFLDGISDKEEPIELDLYTKAFDFSTAEQGNEEKIKIINKVLLQLKNTGASFTVTYSVDDSTTWYPLRDNSGNESWTLPTDGKTSFVRLRPNFETIIPQGFAVMLHINNNDFKEVELQQIKIDAQVRKQQNVVTG